MMTEIEPKLIKVDTVSKTVKVSAGVITRELMNYLARYESGWSLEAFPWFIHQTIGGAVSTGSHGSSMNYKSLSDQVTAMTVVVGNGTLVSASVQEQPALMRALRTMAGRLAVIVDLTLRIVPNDLVRRTSSTISSSQWVADMLAVQAAFKQGGEQHPAVQALGETQLFWYPANDELRKITFEALGADHPPSLASLLIEGSNALNQIVDAQYVQSGPSIESINSRSEAKQGNRSAFRRYLSPLQRLEQFEGAALRAGTVRLQPVQGGPEGRAINPFYNNAMHGLPLTAFLNGVALEAAVTLPDGISPRRQAYINQAEPLYNMHAATELYDQYEVAIPLDKAGDCLQYLLSEMNGPKQLWKGYPIPPLVRFTGSETALIHPAHGTPVMWLNLEDYFTHSDRREGSNEAFMQVFAILRSPVCGGRMHWGKAGWPRFASAFNGAEEYPDTWCQFGCYVRELDPEGKFRSESDVWTWGTVDLEACCGPDGFSPQCQCSASPAWMNVENVQIAKLG